MKYLFRGLFVLISILCLVFTSATAQDELTDLELLPSPSSIASNVVSSSHLPAENSYFPINSNGQSFGSLLANAFGEVIATPDLQLAIGSNGELGYVSSEELNGPTFSTIEEALASNDNPRSEINLYDEEGQIIGVFKFGKR